MAIRMAENYIYLYHIDKFVLIPQFPESIADQMVTNFQSNSPLSRSAPIYSYASSGPRTVQVSIKLHRDIMYSLNYGNSNINLNEVPLGEDYVDVLTREIQAIAVPRYAASEKMVDPPMVAVRFGNDIYIKGIVGTGVSVQYSGPILTVSKTEQSRNDKYAFVDLSFTVSEVDPFGADEIAQMGSFRGLNTTLERRVYTSGNYTRKSTTRATR